MKILMINSVCGIRSTGRICTDLAVDLTAAGHTVKIAYGRESVPEQYQQFGVRIGSDLDVNLHGVKARLLDGSGLGSVSVTKRFIRWIKEYDPDVIHLHNIHGYYLNIKILFDFLRTCGKQILWSFYDCWSFTGHCAHFDFYQCNKWKSGCVGCKHFDEYPKSFVDAASRNFKLKKRLFTGIPNLQLIVPS
ncbi:MAG: glycosyltransferase, partial [Clostridia bacterium]|nr:glycosyltransferase [Clostridia bacterium]